MHCYVYKYIKFLYIKIYFMILSVLPGREKELITVGNFDKSYNISHLSLAVGSICILQYLYKIK